jgi:hypothetical protein
METENYSESMGKMDLKRILALAVMILVASHANTYLGNPTEKAPCELTERATTYAAVNEYASYQ